MTYVKHSTDNPLGHRPWNAMLQRGGLGAFFPNVEALGPSSVMMDRDASNRYGWKRAWYAGAPVPHLYYPPDAQRQYTTPHRAGLGDATTVPTAGPYWGRRPVAPVIARTFTGGSYQPANTNPPSMSAPNAPIYEAPYYPASPVIANQGSTVLATTPSGAQISQSTQNTVIPGTNVPVGWPTSSTYTDSSGNVWAFNTSSATWQLQSSSSSVVAGTNVPVGWPTSSTYTDSSGNVWQYQAALGTWTIIDAGTGAAASTSSITSWLTSQTIIAGLPNYLPLGGGLLAVWLLSGMGKKR
jgi:hypothetical protein